MPAPLCPDTDNHGQICALFVPISGLPVSLAGRQLMRWDVSGRRVKSCIHCRESAVTARYPCETVLTAGLAIPC